MSQPNAEHALMRAALRVAAVLAVPAVGISWWLRGPRGGLTALGGMALLALWFVASGASLAWGAQRGPSALAVAAFGGFVTRVVVLGLVAVVLAPLNVVDGPVLAATVAPALLLLLAYEVRYVQRHAELSWLTLTGKEGA